MSSKVNFQTSESTHLMIDGQQIDCVGVLENSSEYDRINYSENYKPDLTWSFTDDAGHFHAYDKDGKTPTLEWRHSRSYWCESCDDAHTDDWLACAICDEGIKPARYDAGPGSERILTRRSMTLTIPVKVESDKVSVYLSIEGAEFFGFMHIADYRGEYSPSNGETYETILSGQLHNRAQAE